MSQPPIFLKAMARTGGALFFTMLDAHPQIAMSYEIYQDKLLNDKGEPISPVWAIDVLKKISNPDAMKWVSRIPDKNLKTFIARARRGGIEVIEILKELELFYKKGSNFNDLNGRLDFIQRLMELKMYKFGKQYWGGKVNVDPCEIHRRYSDAFFFAMVRDGRDVLASRLNVGNFQTNATKCALEWREGILDFRNFMQHSGARAMEIHYETLVCDPETVMKAVCKFIGIDYFPAILNFHKQDLEFFKNPHGHLSYKQIIHGINTESLGRWKHNLSNDDLHIFEGINRDLLIDYGYLPKSN